MVKNNSTSRSKNSTIPLLNQRIDLGNCELKFNSVTSSNCMENSIPNRLKVVQTQSSFHLVWWKTWFENILSLSKSLWFLSCLFSVQRILRKKSSISSVLKRESGYHQGSMMYYLHTVLSCVLCYLLQCG